MLYIVYPAGSPTIALPQGDELTELARLCAVIWSNYNFGLVFTLSRIIYAFYAFFIISGLGLFFVCKFHQAIWFVFRRCSGVSVPTQARTADNDKGPVSACAAVQDIANSKLESPPNSKALSDASDTDTLADNSDTEVLPDDSASSTAADTVESDLDRLTRLYQTHDIEDITRLMVNIPVSDALAFDDATINNILAQMAGNSYDLEMDVAYACTKADGSVECSEKGDTCHDEFLTQLAATTDNTLMDAAACITAGGLEEPPVPSSNCNEESLVESVGLDESPDAVDDIACTKDNVPTELSNDGAICHEELHTGFADSADSSETNNTACIKAGVCAEHSQNGATCHEQLLAKLFEPAGKPEIDTEARTKADCPEELPKPGNICHVELLSESANTIEATTVKPFVVEIPVAETTVAKATVVESTSAVYNSDDKVAVACTKANAPEQRSKSSDICHGALLSESASMVDACISGTTIAESAVTESAVFEPAAAESTGNNKTTGSSTGSPDSEAAPCEQPLDRASNAASESAACATKAISLSASWALQAAHLRDLPKKDTTVPAADTSSASRPHRSARFEPGYARDTASSLAKRGRKCDACNK
ncbi:hypothetical protein IWW45_008011 [Coemansia sp. RSA 485]|nr:hypothetical protein IWW45_008011 [Coemansia sp. RSA 485]